MLSTRTKLAAIVAFGLAISAVAQDAAPLPRVHLLATGGTIAGGAEGQLTAEQLVAAVPKIAEVAQLMVEDFIRIGSSRITPEIQFNLAKRVNQLFAEDAELAGIVVTHGTDSLEETAFFLDLLVKDPRPVVFAAAQRPPREPDSDGPRNLLNAVLLAASPAMRDLGVVVTLNDEIHAAQDVRKTHSTALDAFKSRGTGPLGYIDNGVVHLHRRPAQRLTLDVESIVPNVDLITLTAGSDGHLVRAAIAAGARGIVIEVFGRGNVPDAVTSAIQEALDKGVVIVFTTRTRGGRVVLYPPFDTMPIVCGQDLDGFKARMLLIVALGKTTDPAVLSGYYRRLSGASDPAP